VPGELAGVVDVGRDGLAFSAALAGLGHPPQSAIDARPTVPTDGWAVESVLPVERLEGSLP
jgi:hypothetical protein